VEPNGQFGLAIAPQNEVVSVSMQVITDHDAIVSRWISASPDELTFPPNCFFHMELRFTEWNPQARTLSARFPMKSEFYNPRNFIQGGFLVAALDNVLGPLSYLSGFPSVTTQLNTTFIRPAASDLQYFEVHAEILDITKTKVYSKAEALGPSGRILTCIQATSQIVAPSSDSAR
jgi:acyl-coenzyme A thioesterase PaaI-like protein